MGNGPSAGGRGSHVAPSNAMGDAHRADASPSGLRLEVPPPRPSLNRVSSSEGSTVADASDDAMSEATLGSPTPQVDHSSGESPRSPSSDGGFYRAHPDASTLRSSLQFSPQQGYTRSPGVPRRGLAHSGCGPATSSLSSSPSSSSAHAHHLPPGFASPLPGSVRAPRPPARHPSTSSLRGMVAEPRGAATAATHRRTRSLEPSLHPAGSPAPPMAAPGSRAVRRGPRRPGRHRRTPSVYINRKGSPRGSPRPPSRGSAGASDTDPGSEDGSTTPRPIVDLLTDRQDLDQPWFHKGITRDAAEELLLREAPGRFLIRPSSQRGSYAMSWVKTRGEVRHNLIYGLFPGFSLEQRPKPSDKFATLSSLVAHCPFLQDPLPPQECDNESSGRTVMKNSLGVIEDLVEELLSGDDGGEADDDAAPFSALHSLQWRVSILESLETYTDARKCEKRTYLRYGKEEFVVPKVLCLSDRFARSLASALRTNTTLRRLEICGHEGIMRVNYLPNIGDSQTEALASALAENRGITYLNLSVNRITDRGAQALAQALMHNSTLQHLILRLNFIGAPGLYALACAARHNDGLRFLDMDCQLREGTFSSLTLDTSRYGHQVTGLVKDSLARQQELVGGASVPYFHGGLTRAQAEHRVRSAAGGMASALVQGAFLVYVNPALAHCLCLCWVGTRTSTGGSQRQCLDVGHQTVYRTQRGYSFRRHATVGLPSLQQLAAWASVWGSAAASGRQPLHEEDLGLHVPDAIRPQIRQAQALAELWRVSHVDPPDTPGPEVIETHVYPTLSRLVHRHRARLIHPIHAPSPPSCLSGSRGS